MRTFCGLVRHTIYVEYPPVGYYTSEEASGRSAVKQKQLLTCVFLNAIIFVCVQCALSFLMMERPSAPLQVKTP